ncbi:hypothetical protein [Mesorhizobium sp.]|nr:hypothetical protein [Mesorhizobium sp.]
MSAVYRITKIADRVELRRMTLSSLEDLGRTPEMHQLALFWCGQEQ